MAKFSTFPTLYNDCKTLSITELKEWGYLEPYRCKSGTISWSRQGKVHSRIGISVNMFEDSPYMELDYTCNDKPVNYKVYLVSMPSNIGKGVVWYFICPNTGKKCRKLYMADTYFLHRDAFRGCMYEKQTYSKHGRSQFQQWSTLFGDESAYEQIYSKHFKKRYNGKLTKKYKKLLKKISAASKADEQYLIECLMGKDSKRKGK